MIKYTAPDLSRPITYNVRVSKFSI